MPAKLLLVSHDAGGAEILAAWYRKHPHAALVYFILTGPALRIFQRDFGPVPISDFNILERFGEGDFVLTGTSLEAGLEREAIAHCRRLKIKCASFLDHWDLYAIRFSDSGSGQTLFPDEIWVGDDHAWEYALKDGLPLENLRRVDNPYFQAVKAQLPRSREKLRGPGKILFICEPFSQKLEATFGTKALEYDDELANLRQFLEAAADHRERIRVITIRLHPAEDALKYEGLIAPYRKRLPVVYSVENSLVMDLLNHTHIVGIASMALAIGVILKSKVISCITGKPWQISLPHRGIMRISDYNQLFDL